MRPGLPLLTVLTLALAACGQNAAVSTVPSPGAVQLASQAVGSAVTLQVGQTRQVTVRVNGVAATPGQLRWSSSDAAVATVSQSGLITALKAGSATVRAALSSNAGAFIDFPVTVTAAPAPGSGISATEQRVLDLTNQARAAARTCGSASYPAAAPLSWNANLATAARGHAADMAAKNYFSHTSQDGRTFDTRIVNAGYTGWSNVAENIAAGQPTADSVVAGWLSSPGHCADIMNGALKEIGIGLATGGSYGTYWVQDFGARF